MSELSDLSDLSAPRGLRSDQQELPLLKPTNMQHPTIHDQLTNLARASLLCGDSM